MIITEIIFSPCASGSEKIGRANLIKMVRCINKKHTNHKLFNKLSYSHSKIQNIDSPNLKYFYSESMNECCFFIESLPENSSWKLDLDFSRDSDRQLAGHDIYWHTITVYNGLFIVDDEIGYESTIKEIGPVALSVLGDGSSGEENAQKWAREYLGVINLDECLIHSGIGEIEYEGMIVA